LIAFSLDAPPPEKPGAAARLGHPTPARSDELEGVMAAQLVAAQFPRASWKRRAWCRAQWLLLHVEGSEGCVSRPARPCL